MNITLSDKEAVFLIQVLPQVDKLISAIADGIPRDKSKPLNTVNEHRGHIKSIMRKIGSEIQKEDLESNN